MKLSDKHGLNPCINVCFFCGKDKEVLVLGKLKGDAKAPKRVVFNYVPCKDCAAKMKTGRVVIEVSTKDNGMPPIMQGAWPTGRWCVISEDSAAKLFKDTKNNKQFLLEDNLYKELLKAMKK